MNEQKRPLAATIVIIIMGIASVWWIMLAFLYFFGGPWLYEGFFAAWFMAFLYALVGFFGLAITAGLQRELKQAYYATLILAIIFLIFSIPGLATGYGIVGLIMSGILLILLLLPSVRAYFSRDLTAEYVENVTVG